MNTAKGKRQKAADITKGTKDTNDLYLVTFVTLVPFVRKVPTRG